MKKNLILSVLLLMGVILFGTVILFLFTESLIAILFFLIASVIEILVSVFGTYIPLQKIQRAIIEKFSLNENHHVEVLGFPKDTTTNREKLKNAIESLSYDFSFSTSIGEESFEIEIRKVDLTTQELANIVRALHGKFVVLYDANNTFSWFVENSKGEFLSETYSVASSLDDYYEIFENFEPKDSH